MSCPENAAAGLRKKGAKELGGAPGVWPGYQPHCHVAAWFRDGPVSGHAANAQLCRGRHTWASFSGVFKRALFIVC